MANLILDLFSELPFNSYEDNDDSTASDLFARGDSVSSSRCGNCGGRCGVHSNQSE